MEAAGCCFVIILGFVLWVVFLILAGILPALGLLTAGMLWQSGHRGVALLVLFLALMSALAGVVAYDGGFSGANFLSDRAFPAVVFAIAEGALPVGVLASLVYLQARHGFDDPRINMSLTAMLVIACCVIFLHVLGHSVFS